MFPRTGRRREIKNGFVLKPSDCFRCFLKCTRFHDINNSERQGALIFWVHRQTKVVLSIQFADKTISPGFNIVTLRFRSSPELPQQVVGRWQSHVVAGDGREGGGSSAAAADAVATSRHPTLSTRAHLHRSAPRPRLNRGAGSPPNFGHGYTPHHFQSVKINESRLF